MPTGSCPHCGCPGIRFDREHAHAILHCQRCGGQFRPSGGAAEDTVEVELVEEDLSDDFENAPPRREISASKVAIICVSLFAILTLLAMLTVVLGASQRFNDPAEMQARRSQPLPRPAAPTRTPSLRELIAADLATPPSVGMPVYLVMAIIVMLVLAVVFYTHMVVWVANDSRARGMRSRPFWVLGVLFKGPVGLLHYLARRPPGVLVPCSRCGNRKLELVSTCPHCGESARRGKR